MCIEIFKYCRVFVLHLFGLIEEFAKCETTHLKCNSLELSQYRVSYTLVLFSNVWEFMKIIAYTVAFKLVYTLLCRRPVTVCKMISNSRNYSYVVYSIGIIEKFKSLRVKGSKTGYRLCMHHKRNCRIL